MTDGDKDSAAASQLLNTLAVFLPPLLHGLTCEWHSIIKTWRQGVRNDSSDLCGTFCTSSKAQLGMMSPNPSNTSPKDVRQRITAIQLGRCGQISLCDWIPWRKRGRLECTLSGDVLSTHIYTYTYIYINTHTQKKIYIYMHIWNKLYFALLQIASMQKFNINANLKLVLKYLYKFWMIHYDTSSSSSSFWLYMCVCLKQRVCTIWQEVAATTEGRLQNGLWWVTSSSKASTWKPERLYRVSNVLRLADVWEPRVHLLGYFLQEALAELKKEEGRDDYLPLHGQQEASPRRGLRSEIITASGRLASHFCVEWSARGCVCSGR